MADVEWVKEGLRMTIRRGKTDQEGAGATIAIPEGRRLRPRMLLDAWVQQGVIVDGFLFRRLIRGKAGEATVSASPMSDRAVARLVQARVLSAGYDPASFRALAAIGVPHCRRPLGRQHLQDARSVAAQIHAGAGRLRP